nr:hypothetical protein B0A51_05101 [Rachicladosporium sp. CCFEE 5018]
MAVALHRVPATMVRPPLHHYKPTSAVPTLRSNVKYVQLKKKDASKHNRSEASLPAFGDLLAYLAMDDDLQCLQAGRHLSQNVVMRYIDKIMEANLKENMTVLDSRKISVANYNKKAAVSYVQIPFFDKKPHESHGTWLLGYLKLVRSTRTATLWIFDPEAQYTTSRLKLTAIVKRLWRYAVEDTKSKIYGWHESPEFTFSDSGRAQTLTQSTSKDSGVHVGQIADFLAQSRETQKGYHNGIDILFRFEEDSTRSRHTILATLVKDASSGRDRQAVWPICTHIEIAPHAVRPVSKDLLVPCPLSSLMPGASCQVQVLPSKDGRRTHILAHKTHEYAAVLYDVGHHQCHLCHKGFLLSEDLLAHEEKVHAPPPRRMQEIFSSSTRSPSADLASGSRYESDLNRHLVKCKKHKKQQKEARLLSRVDPDIALLELLPGIGGVVVVARSSKLAGEGYSTLAIELIGASTYMPRLPSEADNQNMQREGSGPVRIGGAAKMDAAERLTEDVLAVKASIREETHRPPVLLSLGMDGFTAHWKRLVHWCRDNPPFKFVIRETLEIASSGAGTLTSAETEYRGKRWRWGVFDSHHIVAFADGRRVPGHERYEGLCHDLNRLQSPNDAVAGRAFHGNGRNQPTTF